MAIRFSDVLEQMGPSDLGPLLALTAQPDIISFAGGLPAPKTFPLKELTEVAIKVREEDGAGAMQYGPSLGFLGLREAIADRMNKMYMPMGMEKVEAKNIMVVTGSQQGLDITGRVFLNKGDPERQIHLRHSELPEPDRPLHVPRTPQEIHGNRHQI